MSKTQVPTGGIADNAIVTGKITDATIASGDLADDAVTAAKIADAVGLGKILQVQTATANDRDSVSSTSFTGAGIEDTITCASSSSKVLVIIAAQFGCDSNNADNTYTTVKFQLSRNHSGISETSIYEAAYQHNRPENSGMDMIFQGICAIAHTDSSSTTNEITYKLNAKVDPSTTSAEIIQGGSNEFDKTITLIEIGA